MADADSFRPRRVGSQTDAAGSEYDQCGGIPATIKLDEPDEPDEPHEPDFGAQGPRSGS